MTNKSLKAYHLHKADWPEVAFNFGCEWCNYGPKNINRSIENLAKTGLGYPASFASAVENTKNVLCNLNNCNFVISVVLCNLNISSAHLKYITIK